jgi:AICAR transformylase/IMP cyclohydrolase PurH
MPSLGADVLQLRFRGTNFRRGLDGRVKTLHPAVHAALRAMTSNPEHMKRWLS